MCTRQELESHFQAVKEFRQIIGEIAALRKQGVRPGEAYRQVVSSRNNPQLSRYYAPTLYAYAMTAPVEPVPQDVPKPQPEPIIEQEPQKEATGAAALSNGETKEQAETENTHTGVSEITPVEVSQVEEITPDRELEETPLVALEIAPSLEPSLSPTPDPEPTPIGVVLGRDVETQELIRLPDSQRQSGLNIVGVAGSGKSTVMENIFVTDVNNGHGGLFVDVQGDSIDHILERLPDSRLNDVILLEPGANNNPFGINLLAHSENGVDHDVDVGMSVVKRISGVGTDQPFWGPRLATLLRNGLYTLWYNELTLAELPILLRDKDFRAACLKNIPEPGRWVTFFWEHDFNNLSAYLQMEHSESTLNKIYQLLTIREVEYVVSQKKTTIDFRQLMDERKILLLKLPKHTIGEDAVTFLGTVAFTSLLEAARSRADVAIEDRPFFSVVLDEFGSMTSPLFPQMFAELRKFNLSFSVGYQYIAQLDEENRGATQQLTNQMTFRVRPKDAETLAHFYAKEPTVLYKEQEKKTPVTRPVNWLVGGGRSHESEAVNAFVKGWEEIVRNASMTLSEGQRDTYRTSAGRRGRVTSTHYSTSWSNKEEVLPAREGLEMLNDVLYQAMLEKNPHQVVPIALVRWMAEKFGLPFFDYERYAQMKEYLYEKEMHEIRWGETEYCEMRFCKGDCGKEHCLFSHHSRKSDQYIPYYLTTLSCYQLSDFYPLRDYFSFLLETIAWGEERKRTDEDIDLCLLLWLIEDDKLDQIFGLYEKRVREILNRDMLLPVPYFLDDVYIYGDGSPWGLYPDEEHQDFPDPEHILVTNLEAFANVRSTQKIHACEWLQLDFAALQWEKEDLEPRIAAKEDYYRYKTNLLQGLAANIDERKFLASLPEVEYPYHTWRWVLKPGQVTPEMIEPFLQAEIDRIISEQKPAFETFVRQLRAVMQALAENPILEGNGEYELVEASRRSIADMVNDMAQELIHLPNREAYVKLGVSGAESVKIQTLPLEPGCSPEELESRKRAITENTLPYTSNRADVEAELQKRHTAYTTGKKPQVQQQSQETTQEQTKETYQEPQKEETQSHYDIRRVCPASGTIPSEQHSIVFADEKTTGDTYLTLLYYFSHLVLQQAVRLTGKQTSVNNERTKLNKLVKDGLVVSEPMKESVSGGKAPLVYSLTPKGYKYLEAKKGLSPLKKSDYTKHSYLVNEMLITAILAAKTNETVKLVDFEHEKMFRMKPIQLQNGKGVEPDGLLIYQAGQNIAPIAFEVDLSIETREQLIDKVQKYLQTLQGPYTERCGVDAVTIAFVVPNGTANDVARLVGIIEAALEHDKEAASLFLVGAFDPLQIEPGDVLFAPIFAQPFRQEKHALIE